MDLSHRVRGVLSFVHTAEAGSFAGAARSMGVSAAAVSKNVARLEESIGIRLLNRTTRTVTLTEEGASFLAQARVALDALDVAVDTVVQQRAVPCGRVRISTSIAFGHELLVPLLPGLLAQYPKVSVEMDFDDRVVDFVRDGYDMVFRGGHIHDSARVSRAICHLSTLLVASPHYLAQYGVPDTQEALATHRLIVRRFLSGAVDCWGMTQSDGSIEMLDFADQAAVVLSAPEAIVSAACVGMGVAQVPVHLAWKHLVAGDLKIVLPHAHDRGHYEMTLQYPHRTLMAPRVRAVVDYLLEQLAQSESLHVSPAVLEEYCA